MRRVAIGSDHAGFELKEYLKTVLTGRDYDVVDVGTSTPETTDYPPFCIAVGEAVARGDADFGIVLGGSGQGEQIAANKVNGVRAALCNDPHAALLARRHNDANVISFGARVIAKELAVETLETWEATEFEAGRHVRRIELIREYEFSRDRDM